MWPPSTRTVTRVPCTIGLGGSEQATSTAELDGPQRPLRARIEELANGRSVLDAYSYVGACALAAARGGATRVKAVDSSGLAMEVGVDCARRNGLHERIGFEHGDARRCKASTRAGVGNGGSERFGVGASNR